MGSTSGNVRVGDGGEAPVDAAGRGRAPVGADLAQGIDEGEDAVLVVEQHALVVAGLNSAEGHGRAVGKPQGEDGRGDVGPEGHDAGVPADLHPGLQQLLGHGGVVVLGGEKDVEAALLVFLDDHLGRCGIRGSADDGGEPGGGAVHELNPALAEHGVVGRTEPDLAGLLVDLLGVQVEVRLVQVAQGLPNLEAEECRHAGVQQRPEIGQVVHALDVRRKQLADHLQRLLHVFQLLDLEAEQGVNHRQIVGGVGKPHRGVGVEGLQRLLVLAFDLRNDVVGSLDRGKCN